MVCEALRSPITRSSRVPGSWLAANHLTCRLRPLGPSTRSWISRREPVDKPRDRTLGVLLAGAEGLQGSTEGGSTLLFSALHCLRGGGGGGGAPGPVDRHTIAPATPLSASNMCPITYIAGYRSACGLARLAGQVKQCCRERSTAVRLRNFRRCRQP